MVLNETYHFPDWPLWPHLPKVTAFQLCPWSTYLLYPIKPGIFSLPQKVVLLAVLPFWFFLHVFLLLHEKLSYGHCFTCSHYKNHEVILKQGQFLKHEVKQGMQIFWYSCFIACFILYSYFTRCLRLHLLLHLLHRCEPGFKLLASSLEENHILPVVSE